jgi:AraC-like DNA-binding protein
MNSFRYAPTGFLAQFVTCLWYFQGTRAKRELALPTGTVELVINLRDEPVRIYSDVSDTLGRKLDNAIVSGTQSRYIVLDSAHQTSVLGIHFRPGGATLCFGSPLGELADRQVGLEDLWGSSAKLLREQLQQAGSPLAMFAFMERALLSHMTERAAHHPAVALALRQFTAAPTAARVHEVVKASGYSAKRFIRLFTDGVGLPPKRFCRILRLQSVIQRLARGASVEWPDVAADCGYYDQSHLIRDFRAMTGVTPTQYRPVYADSPNHVAVEE